MLPLKTSIGRREDSCGTTLTIVVHLRASGLAGFFAFASASLAQPLPPVGGAERPAAGSHLEAGLHMRQAEAAMRRGSVDEAVALYERAVVDGAPPVVFRELALVFESVSRWRDAARAWTRYGSSALAAADREAAFVRREALRRRSSVLSVRVSPPLAARTARVWFDHDAPRYYHAGGAETLIEGGLHRVRVESVGFRAFEVMVTTGYGEPRELRVTMSPLAPPEAPPTAPQIAPPRV